jgi:hypothetical protein
MKKYLLLIFNIVYFSLFVSAQTEPSEQAHDINFSSIASTSVTISWTRGNGDSVIIIGCITKVGAGPQDGTFNYIADANFGDGSALGLDSDNYVVYKGDGTTVDITGLSPNTTYEFRAFEYNESSGNKNYYSSSATNNPKTFTTINSEPTTQTQTISFSSLQTTQITVSISGGSGDNHLVLVKEAAAVNAIPNDGTEYTGNTSFGLGDEIGTGNFVVSAGTSTSFTVTNLKQNTRYYFKVYDYNNTGTATDYKTDGFSSGNPTDTITPKSAPGTQALNISFSNITTSSFDVTWDRGDGDSIMIVIKQSSTLTETPTQGTSYSPNPAYGSGETIATGCYVVYTGTDTTVNITGLSSGTQYTVKAFEFNNTEPYTSYLTSDATNNPVSKYSVTTEPTTQAKDIIFSNVQSNSVSLSWTDGDGLSRIVLAHKGSAVDANPVDGFVYTANAVFGSGNEIGTGNYVVYSGTGSGVTVTNLLANTTYYFKVYEFNGTNDALNYLLTDGASGNPASKTTAQGKPNTQASGISFSSIAITSYTVSWSSNGDGDSVIVVGKVGATLSEQPTDGVSYSANASFGSSDEIATGCYVVYAGTGSSVAVTNLSANTNYTFKVFAYNSITGNAYYNNDGATDNPLSRYTLANEPTTQVSGVGTSNITATQMDLSWTAGTGGGNRIVLVHEGTTVDENPVDGTEYTANSSFGDGSEIGTGNFVVYSSNGTSVTITNLKQNTTYYFKVYEYGGTSTSSNFLITGTGNTANATTIKAEPVSQATSITFSNLDTTSYTVNWTRGDASNTGVIIVAKQGSAISNVPQDGTTYTANAAFGTGSELASGSGEYVVYAGTGTSENITSLSTGTEYYFRAFEYNNTGSDIDYLTTTADENPNSQFTLDNEPTIQVTSFGVGTINPNSLDLSWTNGNGTGRIIIARQSANITTNPIVDGHVYNANASFGSGDEVATGIYVIYAGTGTSATITNLLGQTQYYFKIYEYNDNGAINYLFTDAPVTQATTGQKEAPTVQATSINFTNLNTTSFTINWTKGNGEKRLVAVKEGNQGTIANPTNGNTYTASADWSSKGTQLGSSGYYTVYSDTGSTVSLTNLNTNTEYWVQIFEYNNSPGNEKYLTSTATDNPNSQTTLKPAPTSTATNIALSSITSTSITVSWTNGDGDNRIVVARETSTTNAIPGDFTAYSANTSFGAGDVTGTGNYVVYNGTDTTATVTRLTESTSYTFIVYEYNNSGNNAIYNKTITADANSKSATTLGPITWQGDDSSSPTDWNTAENWDSGSVPSSSVSVIIPSTTNKPIIGSGESYTIEKLTINAGGALTISTGASLSVSGNVLLKSPSDNNASGQLVIKGTGSISVSGTSKMERYYPTTSNWRLVSAPVSSPAISTWTGYYVNAYNEPNASWDHLNSNSSISIMQGVSVLNSSGSNTITFSGTFNTGDLSINVTNSSPGDDNYGWSIVGNPYPCALDWSSSTGVTFNNVDATAYIYDASAGSYVTCSQSTCSPSGSPVIAAGQGFFIHATNNGSLALKNDARTVSTQTFRKSGKLSFPLIRLIADNGIYTSEALIMFDYEATNYFDSKFDAYKLLSTNDTIADIYTLLSDNTYLAINALNVELLNNLSAEGLLVPIGLTKGVSGAVNISASVIENIPDNINVYLYDLNLDKYVNLREDNYDLYIDASIDDRLQLIITTKVLSIDENNDFTDMLIYVNDNCAFVKSHIFESEVGVIQVYDISGKLMLTKTTDKSVVQKFDIYKQGIYIIRVIFRDKVINQKVIVK